MGKFKRRKITKHEEHKQIEAEFIEKPVPFNSEVSFKDYDMTSVSRHFHSKIIDGINLVMKKNFHTENLPELYSLTGEDLKTNVVYSNFRLYFSNEDIVGFAVLYVREHDLNISGQGFETCYVSRGGSLILEEYRSRNLAEKFTFHSLNQFASNHQDKEFFFFSESASPVTLTILIKNMDGYAGLPTTLEEARHPDYTWVENTGSRYSKYDLDQVCDEITRIIEPSQADLYAQSGRIALPEILCEYVPISETPSGNAIKAFSIMENPSYFYSTGYAIPTVVHFSRWQIWLGNKKFNSSFFSCCSEDHDISHYDNVLLEVLERSNHKGFAPYTEQAMIGYFPEEMIVDEMGEGSNFYSFEEII